MPQTTQLGSTEAAGNGQINAGILRFSVAYFLVTLVLLYVAAPFLEHLQGGILIDGVLMTLVLSSAVLAVSSGRRALALALGLAIPAITAKWVSYWRPDLLPPEVSPLTGLLFVFFVVLHLFRGASPSWGRGSWLGRNYQSVG